MATDKTEPPTLRIVLIGLGSIATLVGLQFVFTAYFQQMYAAQAAVNQTGTLERDARLYGASLTRPEGHSRAVSQAMESLAANPGQRPAALATAPSTDTAALVGWALMPRAVPASPPPPPAPPPAVPLPAEVPTLDPAAVPGPLGAPTHAAPGAPTPGAAPAPAPAGAVPAAAPALETPVAPGVPAAPTPPAPETH